MFFTAKNRLIGGILLLILLIQLVEGFNKYSEQANKPKKTKNSEFDFAQDKNIKKLRELDKPFRMHKINLVWAKARHRLTDVKLRSLFSDLTTQDKVEIAFKHYKADSDKNDDTGVEEAKIRKRLKDIMITYDLLEHFEQVDDNYKKPKPFKDRKHLDNYVPRDVFKDKRLNQLWAKAEAGGFSHEELETLKEEFNHHQDKVDEYMSLLAEIEAGDPDKNENSIHEKPVSWNEIEYAEETNEVPGKKKDYLAKANLLKKKHLDVRSGYDHLEGLTAKAPKHNEFFEPKVINLWRLAQQANFTTNELNSLKEELLHYEKRLKKLQHLHAEAALEAAKAGKEYRQDPTANTKIKRHALEVEKFHNDFESKIMEKHVEL